MLYQKILVAVDGSEYFKCALQEAIKVAKVTGGAITLVHAYPSGSTVVISKQHFYESLQEKSKTMLAADKK
jgi:nucleotide-binding universal stress UspA family protein